MIMKSIPLYVEYKGKSVLAGILSSQGTFNKTVLRKDKLLILDSYGFDVEYMKDVYAQGAKWIDLKVRDTDEHYQIDTPTFKKYAVKRSIGKFGQRLYCPLKYWKRIV
jgi:alanyl-tRNA synthetase